MTPTINDVVKHSKHDSSVALFDFSTEQLPKAFRFNNIDASMTSQAKLKIQCHSAENMYTSVFLEPELEKSGTGAKCQSFALLLMLTIYAPGPLRFLSIFLTLKDKCIVAVSMLLVTLILAT